MQLVRIMRCSDTARWKRLPGSLSFLEINTIWVRSHKNVYFTALRYGTYVRRRPSSIDSTAVSTPRIRSQRHKRLRSLVHNSRPGSERRGSTKPSSRNRITSDSGELLRSPQKTQGEPPEIASRMCVRYATWASLTYLIMREHRINV